jgi:hypothetical protein
MQSFLNSAAGGIYTTQLPHCLKGLREVWREDYRILGLDNAQRRNEQ